MLKDIDMDPYHAKAYSVKIWQNPKLLKTTRVGQFSCGFGAVWRLSLGCICLSYAQDQYLQWYGCLGEQWHRAWGESWALLLGTAPCVLACRWLCLSVWTRSSSCGRIAAQWSWRSRYLRSLALWCCTVQGPHPQSVQQESENIHFITITSPRLNLKMGHEIVTMSAMVFWRKREVLQLYIVEETPGSHFSTPSALARVSLFLLCLHFLHSCADFPLSLSSSSH